MRLWIAVHLHRLRIDALRQRWPLDASVCVVLDHDRVAALTEPAQSLGLSQGMRKGGVAALAPQALLFERDPGAEDESLRNAALALLQYTPEIAYGQDHTLLMDVSASLMMFNGPRNLTHRIAGTLRTLDLSAHLGMAPTAAAAWLLARHGARRRRRALTTATTHRRVKQLPVAVLPQAQDGLGWLHGIGCHTLGDLCRLPRAGLQRRAGTALAHALDAAFGMAAECHAWIVPARDFQRRIELNERLEYTGAVMAVARRLIEQLSGWLTAHQLAVPSLAWHLEHERGRHACAPTIVTLALAEPGWQAAHLQSLLQEKLGRLTLQAPVVAVALHASDTVPRPQASATLFSEPGGSATERTRLLELLTARLGKECVRQPRPVADHRPESANRWQDAIDARALPAPPLVQLDRPFWLLDPPIALTLREHHPFYQAPLTLLRGPERIETGWWEPPLAVRDYFVAEAPDRSRYWIYRERDAGSARWFLHGLYG